LIKLNSTLLCALSPHGRWCIHTYTYINICRRYHT
jgi:hypothetical protein